MFLVALGRADRDPGGRSSSGVPFGAALGLMYGVSSLAIKGTSVAFTGRTPVAAVLDLVQGPYPWLLAISGAAGLALSQTALQRCRASVIVPVTTTVSCVFTVAAGTVVFGEHLPTAPLQLVLRLGGTALAVAVLLALPRYDDKLTPAPTPASAPA
jgi:uncharacterized membrane protein